MIKEKKRASCNIQQVPTIFRKNRLSRKRQESEKGGRLKPVTLKTVISAFFCPRFPYLLCFPHVRSVKSAQTLVFVGGERHLPQFPHFPCIGSNRRFRKAERPALLRPRSANRETTIVFCGFLRKSAVFCPNLRLPNLLFYRASRK